MSTARVLAGLTLEIAGSGFAAKFTIAWGQRVIATHTAVLLVGVSFALMTAGAGFAVS